MSAARPPAVALPDLSAGLCTDADPELWHDWRRQDEAVAICRRCPVREPCGTWADEVNAVGVWGGRAHWLSGDPE